MLQSCSLYMLPAVLDLSSTSSPPPTQSSSPCQASYNHSRAQMELYSLLEVRGYCTYSQGRAEEHHILLDHALFLSLETCSKSHRRMNGQSTRLGPRNMVRTLHYLHGFRAKNRPTRRHHIPHHARHAHDRFELTEGCSGANG